MFAANALPTHFAYQLPIAKRKLLFCLLREHVVSVIFWKMSRQFFSALFHLFLFSPLQFAKMSKCLSKPPQYVIIDCFVCDVCTLYACAPCIFNCVMIIGHKHDIHIQRWQLEGKSRYR